MALRGFGEQIRCVDGQASANVKMVLPSGPCAPSCALSQRREGFLMAPEFRTRRKKPL